MMIIIRTAFLVTCAIGVLGLSEAMAAHEYFKSIDIDADGKVDVKEFAEDMKGHAFEMLDKDKSRMLSKEEWERLDTAQNKEEHLKLFERMDRDRDRRISFLEFSDYAERHSNIEEAFMGLDKDRNNSLTPDELTIRPLFKLITIRF